MKKLAIALLALSMGLSGAAPVLAEAGDNDGYGLGYNNNFGYGSGMSYCDTVAMRAANSSSVRALCEAGEAEAEEAVEYEIADYPSSIVSTCRDFSQAAGGSHLVMDGCLGAWLDMQPEPAE